MRLAIGIFALLAFIGCSPKQIISDGARTFEMQMLPDWEVQTTEEHYVDVMHNPMRAVLSINSFKNRLGLFGGYGKSASAEKHPQMSLQAATSFLHEPALLKQKISMVNSYAYAQSIVRGKMANSSEVYKALWTTLQTANRTYNLLLVTDETSFNHFKSDFDHGLTTFHSTDAIVFRPTGQL